MGDVYTCGRGSATGISWKKGYKSTKPLRIPRLSNIAFKVMQLSCGADHMLCLTSSYSVLALGGNGCRQLAIPDKKIESVVEPVSVKLPDSIVPIQVCCGAAHSLILTASGGLYGWGLNDCAQL